MKKVNLSTYYPVGWMLHPLTEVEEGDGIDKILPILYGAKVALETLAASETPLNLCKPLIDELRPFVDSLIDTFTFDKDRGLTFGEWLTLVPKTKELETLLRANLDSLDTYLVSPKLGYDTSVLIAEGDELVYESLRAYLSKDVKDDLRSAARCLAFELPTAVGFHILRAVEGLVLELMRVTPGVTMPTKGSDRSLYKYIDTLKPHIDPKVLLPLDQIRSLHRNELMHPDVTLSMEEAAALFDVSKAAINTLVIEIRKRHTLTLPTPTTAPATT